MSAIESTVVEVNFAALPEFIELITDDYWAFRYCKLHLPLALQQEVDLNAKGPFPGEDPALSAGKTCWPVVASNKSVLEVRGRSLSVLTPALFWHHGHRLIYVREAQAPYIGFCRICDWRELG